MLVMWVCWVVTYTSFGKFPRLQVEKMHENLQETCLEMIRKHDASLAHLEAAVLEERITNLVNSMKEKVLPVRINHDEASLEPPVFMGTSK